MNKINCFDCPHITDCGIRKVVILKGDEKYFQERLRELLFDTTDSESHDFCGTVYHALDMFSSRIHPQSVVRYANAFQMELAEWEGAPINRVILYSKLLNLLKEIRKAIRNLSSAITTTDNHKQAECLAKIKSS